MIIFSFLVIDNAQNSPEIIDKIYKNIDIIRKANSAIKVIIIGWPQVNEIINEVFKNITTININSVDTIDELINQELEKNLNEKYSDGIKHLASKDVLVAKQIIKYVKNENVLPTKQIIGNMMFNIIVKGQHISDESLLVLYYISILGQFEIQTSYKFLETISQKGIDELIELNIIKYNKNKEYCFLGHRSLNNQIVLFLENTFMKNKKLYALDDISNYVMKANKNQIINILERLDLNNRKLTNNKKILKIIWNTFTNLQEKLYMQLDTDITWNNNLYSSIQSCNTLAFMEFDKKSKTQFELQKNYIDQVAGINSTNEFQIYKDTTEKIDIALICKAMKEDDKYFPINERHDKIDQEKFYKTYTIGMMLGCEALLNNNLDTIHKYVDILKDLQDDDGSFYPRRVPWVTARIIISLTKVGYNYNNSEIVKKACDWLLSDVQLLSSESNDESQKAALIINYLIKIIFEILKKEATSLLISLQYEKKEGTKTNYIAIHGSFSSPYSNWFSWLYSIITERGQEIIIPQFPIEARQNYKNWSRILKEYLDIGIINENTVIIGHSIAPIFICKFLIENQIRVKRLIFVCGFNNVFNIASDYDMVNSDMFTENIERIHEYCDDIVCLYSDNDPYVPFEKEKEFADLVSDRREVIIGGGHLNAETGYTKFNELLKYL